MNTPERNRLVEQIRTQYADIYDTLSWIDQNRSLQAQNRREDLISQINGFPEAQWYFSGTKLVSRDLSPGCRLCGRGEWSCLFINNLCNAACFYCPASQKELSTPATGRLEFNDPIAYADYVEAFGINGVSFSGGEPLISFDRVMAFLTTLRKTISRPLYIWMYTNGILASQDKFKALAEAGLDEVRFDLSATAYDMTGLEKAIGIIPRVTVEIPAIPQDVDSFKPMMGRLASAGVNFLNLHQIRCTGFNSQKLAARGYTFVHGPGITVLETELAALELIRYSLEHRINLPVNYCAFTFRHQFQRAGTQKRSAALVKSPWESITPTGQIRTITLTGQPPLMSSLQDRLAASGRAPELWQKTPKGDQIHLHPDLLEEIETEGLSLKLVYSGTALAPSVSYRHRFTQIRLNPQTTVVVERFPRHREIILTGGQISWYRDCYLKVGSNTDASGARTSIPAPPGSISQTDSDLILSHESITPGLAPYF